MLRDDIIFDEEKHTYTYHGKKLQGVTARISKRSMKNFPGQVQRIIDARDNGKLFHKEVEEFFLTGKEPVNADVYFVENILEAFPRSQWTVRCEMLVSNYKCTASAIDIVMYREDNGKKRAVIFDIKTGVFDREYCSWQLGFYKWFLEIEGDFIVEGCFVISSKDKAVYRIIPKSIERCKTLL